MSPRKRAILLVGCSVLAISLCAMGARQLFFRHCLLWTCAPQRSFKAVDLGIPMDFFPVGAVGGAMGPTHESEGAIDKGTMSVSWNKGQGTAIYSVWRFGTVWEAEAFFALLSSGDEAYGFGPCNGFATPAVHANEFAVTCGWSNFAGYRANMDARYEEFVIGLYVGLDEEMTSEDFRRVVVFVDHQMTAKLNPK